MAKKRRRLKPRVKKIMKRTGIVLQAVAVSTFAAANLISAITVKDNKASQKDLIRAMMSIYGENQNNTSLLKQCVIDVYNGTTGSDLSKENTAVVMVSPSVVTTPTINNSVFVVAEYDGDTANTGSSKITKVSENTVSVKENIGSIFTKVFAEEDNSDSEDNTVKPEIYETDFSSAIQVALQDEGFDLDRVSALPDDVDRNLYQTLYKVTSDNGQLGIVLSAASITLSDTAEFNPYDYIVSTTSKDGALPRISVEGNVNPYVNGTYTETYTVTDSFGNKVTASMQVTVNVTNNPDEMQLEQQIKAMRALYSYAYKMVGQVIDVDGAYNDQCWDLWASYCIENGMDFDYHTQPYGYAFGVSLKYYTSGASKYFQAIKAEDVQPGDWLFWDYGSTYPLSHVALLLQNNGDGTGVCLTQTEGEGVTIQTLQLDLMDVNMRPIGQYAWYAK